jgi:hypothetical protein
MSDHDFAIASSPPPCMIEPPPEEIVYAEANFITGAWV